MRGCMKGYRVPEMLYHPKRLLKPLIRTGRRGCGEFRKAEWEEALDLAAGQIRETIDRKGPGAIPPIFRCCTTWAGTSQYNPVTVTK